MPRSAVRAELPRPTRPVAVALVPSLLSLFPHPFGARLLFFLFFSLLLLSYARCAGRRGNSRRMADNVGVFPLPLRGTAPFPPFPLSLPAARQTAKCYRLGRERCWHGEIPQPGARVPAFSPPQEASSPSSLPLLFLRPLRAAPGPGRVMKKCHTDRAARACGVSLPLSSRGTPFFLPLLLPPGARRTAKLKEGSLVAKSSAATRLIGFSFRDRKAAFPFLFLPPPPRTN